MEASIPLDVDEAANAIAPGVRVCNCPHESLLSRYF